MTDETKIGGLREFDGVGGHSPDALTAIADQTLSYFEDAAATAETALATDKAPSLDVLASVNTLTGLAAQTLTGISEETRRNLEAVVARPAIARVEVLNEANEREVIFITPAGAPRGRWGDLRIASYRSPVGRLAAVAVGSEIEVATKASLKSYELVGRAKLNPERSAGVWDSRDTVVEQLSGRPLTIVSLRALLRAPASMDDALADLERIIAKSARANNVYEGLRRKVLERMGLREQPLLDQYQDEIFRLPLDARIAVLGPPGSGKTTTLIKRLGLKLDLQVLEDDLAVIDRTRAGRRGHATSWLMLSPSELLRQYVKEAFAREQVPASDHQIQVWDVFRRDTARNRLGILRSANSSGAILKEGLQNLQPATIEDQISWFEDFDTWQKQAFWAELKDHAERVAASEDPEVRTLGTRLTRIVESGLARDIATPFVEFRGLSREVGDRAKALQDEIDRRLRFAFARELQKDAELFNKLGAFLATLQDSHEAEHGEDGDGEEEDDDSAATDRAAVDQAFDAYLSAMRAQARALATGRKLGPRSRPGQIVQWLGQHAPPNEELKAIGASVLMAASLRRLANPMRAYLNGVSRRYRRFRRVRLAEGLWYEKVAHGPVDLSPLEVDAILLGMLRAGRMLLAESRIASVVDEASITSLQAVRELFRTQVVVDEATDFSPVQLACMSALCDPATNAFVACGDFNQRITNWGARSETELKWAAPDIQIHTIRVTYRHSRQLNALAHSIAALAGAGGQAAALPEHVDNEGVDPVLGKKLHGDALVAWLRARILEIELMTESLPSIAVLVNSEGEVGPLADALQAALIEENIQCAACPGGQVRGHDNDVRVFDVQHIKGLEFEAVFFVGVDELAEAKPTLFDKFLYVGATRAAMYLGLTTASERVPEQLRPIESLFRSDWRSGR